VEQFDDNPTDHLACLLVDQAMGNLGSDSSGFLAARAEPALAAALSYWSGFMKAQQGGLW
jgi:hypothetical protein